MNMLDREHDNVRLALRWLLELADVERAQRLAGAMARFWLYRSHVAEAEGWLRALELPGGDAPTLHRLMCLSTLPVFANTRGDQPTLEQVSHEELRLNQQLGYPYDQGFPLVHCAQAAVLGGDFTAAPAYFQAGVEASRASGNMAALTFNPTNLGMIAYDLGSDTEARAHGEAALAAATEEGWTRGFAQAHRLLGLSRFATRCHFGATARRGGRRA